MFTPKVALNSMVGLWMKVQFLLNKIVFQFFGFSHNLYQMGFLKQIDIF
jgi:hypothetical protein